MRQDWPRLARRFLVAVLLVVGGAVAWSLKKPPSKGTSAGSAGTGSGGPAQETSIEDLLVVRWGEGSRPVEVRAKASAGQEGSAQRFRGVKVTFPYVERGRPGTATITADEGLFQPHPQRASFRGNVRVLTDDGFELQTGSLKYLVEPVTEVRSQEAVSFRRGRLSGRADTLLYREGSGAQLTGNVKVQIEGEGGPATEITSATASASREQGFVWFEGGVAIHQGSRDLTAQKLQLKMNPDFSAVERAAAIEDVDLRTAGDTGVPGVGDAAGGGGKRLRCRRLNILFRREGVLEEASAVNPGILELEPGPRDPPERRRLSSSLLHFYFDEQGRLARLLAQAAGAGGPPEQRRTVLVTEPTARPGIARRVESESLEAVLEPASGALQASTFQGGTVFSEPGRKAWAPRATVDERSGQVFLEGGEARVLDDAQGELQAARIVLGTRPRSVAAIGKVRHTIPPQKGKRLGPSGANEAVVVLCNRFDYDSESRRADYRENAILRSGRDEVRAPSIRIEESTQGERRLSASGGVASVWHPQAAKGATKDPAPVQVRSREMVYEEKARQVVYTGEVEIRQDDILSKSPEARALFSEDGRTIDRLLAGPPVEVQQGPRRATGEHGTYTPREEKLVLEGEKVVVQDSQGRVEGRILTFYTRSDRILVDGRDEVRTEAVFRRKEPPKH